MVYLFHIFSMKKDPSILCYIIGIMFNLTFYLLILSLHLRSCANFGEHESSQTYENSRIIRIFAH